MCACMVVSALLTLLNTLKRVIGTIRATYDYTHWFFYLLLQYGVTALFFPFPTLLLSLVCICLFVCLSAVCLSVCMSVCLSVCLSIYLYIPMYLSIYVSLCLSGCLCECLSVCLYVLCIYVGCIYCYKCL